MSDRVHRFQFVFGGQCVSCAEHYNNVNGSLKSSILLLHCMINHKVYGLLEGRINQFIAARYECVLGSVGGWMMDQGTMVYALKQRNSPILHAMAT